MNEVPEYLENNGYPTENTPLDPEVAEAGVKYVDDNERHLSEIQKIIAEEHPDHPGHIPGDIAPIPNTDPSDLSVKQVNGEPIFTPVPDDNTSQQPGFIALTFGALGTTLKSGLMSLIQPDAMKDSSKKGVGNTSVNDLPVPTKQPSDTITDFSSAKAEENAPIHISQAREEVKDAA